MQRIMADWAIASFTSVPHFYLHAEVIARRLLTLQEELLPVLEAEDPWWARGARTLDLTDVNRVMAPEAARGEGGPNDRVGPPYLRTRPPTTCF